MKTCAAADWAVSRTITHNIGHPKGGRLSVRRKAVRYNCSVWVKGDHDGRTFDSDEEAAQFCLERGYTQRYYNVAAAVFKRKWRRSLKAQRIIWRALIVTAESYSNLITAADIVKAQVTVWSGDTMLGTKWFNGFMLWAQRLRPELYAKKKAR